MSFLKLFQLALKPLEISLSIASQNSYFASWIKMAQSDKTQIGFGFHIFRLYLKKSAQNLSVNQE